ncbi:NADH-quinone oxidoreductase subunit G [Marinihelvus fidelis]|uniref:NADH-quinone oxidoreductase n=1 Tax=Marinihelvus fidelis TaxID=2613842 RepID=A0A5N0T5A3_9GAMM|nr:NADH-quinone oxidoreductase subunit NuoG [Marinihelvus fidelis]KAA9130260.1 NADH-quinone oxidoreductase subunit G [Marinihelvus fidelis]
MSAVTGEQAVDMVNIEVDGIAMQVPKNSMIIEATDKAGINVPRFCYHKKLSIAANCRMCLVDVEKAPKPMPACATPVMEGMKVYTTSRRAIDAQHGVMEFLLINHPLDCPICDQGGECELQDLAMGYGRSVSRFTERKRVVKDKNIGPLVQTDMTRCIHCTRCVRFLDEVAGTCEMGGTGRGDRLEITSSIAGSIDSEMSGNIIDLCPVGALTNKPFRFSARAWELQSRPSTAAHDGLGSGIHFHVRRGKVMRAVPADRESVNETWLSDRDRYSHFGLYAEDRVLAPSVKRDGEWVEVTWDEAIEAAADALRGRAGDDIGVLMSPSAATEDYFLARRLADGLGTPHIDHRARECDFADDGARPSLFGAPLASIQNAKGILLVGCNARQEAPVLGHRVRQAWRAGASVFVVNPLDWNFHFDVAGKVIAAPQSLAGELAAVALAVAEASGQALPENLSTGDVTPGDAHRAIARGLADAEGGVVIVGHAAMAMADAARVRQLAAWVAEATGTALNLLPMGGNTAGAAAARALPGEGGLNARAMLESPRRAYLLWDVEPQADTFDPAVTGAALAAADKVVAVTSFAGGALRDAADVILPLTPWAETEGSLVSLDGLRVDVSPAGQAAGESRPGWKVLRRLGTALALEGFDHVNIAAVRADMDGHLAAPTAPGLSSITLPAPSVAAGMWRVGEVPMYSTDALCRRSAALQDTVHAEHGFVGLNPADAEALGLVDGGSARVAQGDAAVVLNVRVTDAVPANAAWVRASTPESAELGPVNGPITVSRPGGND